MIRFPLVLITLVTLSAGAAARSAAPEPVGRRFIVEETTIAQVHAAFRSGALTCRGLVDTYLARIDKFDAHGPSLNAISSINPQARAEAARLDQRFAEEGLTGPLHCVPVIVKENIETQGWETTAGSMALRGLIPARDATAITRLKEAGALILAKSNMADLALSALQTSNLIHGRTKNPYDLDRVAAGSSGGTATAIAANFGLVGLGTDTGSSVRGPAAHASLVGIRPTMGLTSRQGLIPLNRLSDVIGPMARTVEDAAAVLEVLMGFDADDPATEVIRSWTERPSVLTAMGDSLEGLRLGVLRQAYQGGGLKVDPQVARVFARTLNDLESLGATVVDTVTIPHVPSSPLAELCQGLKYDLNEYLAAQGPLAPVRSLSAIISSGKFDPVIREELLAMEAADTHGPGSAACEASTKYRAAVAAALSSEMERLQLDALVYPTWSQLPQRTSNVNVAGAGQTLRFATASGNPALTVPMGFTQEGLPLGLSVLGRKWSEAGLVRVAYAYQQATGHRRPPVLAPPIACLCPEIR